MESADVALGRQEASIASGSRHTARRLATLVLCAGILLSLGLLEALVRFIDSRGATPPWSDRPDFYYRAVLGQSNPAIFHELKTPKAAGTFRLGVVGDSISFAPHMQFDDTFAGRLDRMLNWGSPQVQAEVINYGVPGYSTSHEVNSVKVAIQDQVDFLLLQITLNDPEITALDKKHEESQQRFGPYVPPQSLAGLFKIWRTPAFVLERLHNTRTQREYVNYFRELFSNPETLSGFTNSLAGIAELSRNHQVPVMAVIFPLFGHPLDDSYPFLREHEVIHAILKSHNVTYLDLFDAYKGIPVTRLQVIPGGDLHPNEIAHRIAAESIFSFLVQRSLLPERLALPKFMAQRQNVREPILDHLPKQHFHAEWNKQH